MMDSEHGEGGTYCAEGGRDGGFGGRRVGDAGELGDSSPRDAIFNH